MRNKLKKGLIGFVSFFSTLSSAGTMGALEADALKGGWVIGGNIGYGYLSTTEPDIIPPAFYSVPPSTEIQNQGHHIGHLVGGAYLGYDFVISDRLLMGLEGGYKYLGQSRYRTDAFDLISDFNLKKRVKVTQQALDFLLTGKFYVSKNINFIGKAGAAYVRSKTNEDSALNVAGTYSSLCAAPVIWRIRPEVSLGVGYSINDNLGLNLMYTYIGGADANVTGLYRFYNAQPDSTPAVFQYNALTFGLSYTV